MSWSPAVAMPGINQLEKSFSSYSRLHVKLHDTFFFQRLQILVVPYHEFRYPCLTPIRRW